MTTLNEAEKLYLGNEVVSRVYVGSEYVWPTAPDSLSGLALWYDASKLAGADGAAISSWPNRVAGGPALSLVGSPAPVKRLNGLNGLPVVRFTDGQGGLQQAVRTGVDRNHTLLVVARMWGATRRRVIGGQQQRLNHLLGWWGGKQDLAFFEGWMNNGYAAGDGPAATTDWKLYGSDGTDPYFDAVLADAPIAYYRMKELSGTVATDSSGNNRHGTYAGGPVFDIASPVGAAASFDGVDDTLLFPASLSIPAGSSITIEWWAYVATGDIRGNATVQIQPTDDTANRILSHAPWTDQNIYWDYGNLGGTGRLSVSYASALNKWTLIHLTYDAATGKRAISFDANEIAGAVAAGTPGIARAGGSFSTTWKGAAEELAVYLTALTPERRLAHYSARYPSLRVYSNGAQIATGGTQGWANTFTINQNAESSDSEVAEAVMFNRKLPDDERKRIEGYLRVKWGIAA